jgi:hypothetical protein
MSIEKTSDNNVRKTISSSHLSYSVMTIIMMMMTRKFKSYFFFFVAFLMRHPRSSLSSVVVHSCSLKKIFS